MKDGLLPYPNTPASLDPVRTCLYVGSRPQGEWSKVGVTKNIKGRERQYNSSGPFDAGIRLTPVFLFYHRADAMAAEREFLDAAHLVGIQVRRREWLKLGPLTTESWLRAFANNWKSRFLGEMK